MASFDAERAQEIVTAALGGQRNLLVFAEGALAGRVVYPVGHRVAGVEHTGRRWTARREATVGEAHAPAVGD